MSKPEDVLDIVALYLKQNGYDGLYFESECGCLLSEGLGPCSHFDERCRPGYKTECTGPTDFCDGDCDYHVGPDKEE